MKYFIFLLAVTGCAVEYSTPESTEIEVRLVRNDKQFTFLPIQKYTVAKISEREINNCVTDRIYADAIPYNYVFDPNCPPEIIHPPKFILPNDIGPIIR